MIPVLARELEAPPTPGGVFDPAHGEQFSMSTSDTSPSANRRGLDSWSRSHLSIDRRGYCRVTFDHPPINTIAATTVAELSELVAATIEAQQRCEVWSRRVVVVPSGRLAASAQTTAFVAKATEPPVARQPSWRR